MQNFDHDEPTAISNPTAQNNIIEFPTSHLSFVEPKKAKEIIPTPLVDKMEEEAGELNSLSSYRSEFDWEPMRTLERRNAKNPIRGGFIFKSPIKLVNAHSTCQQCLYAFELDTYGRGCVHNCVYCYAKEQLTSHGYWNNPYPTPLDINYVRKIFYRVFETDSHSKLRPILESRIPIRIGSMSDSFMWMDDKFKVTKELLKILKFYRYPHIIFTRSDLLAKDDYLEVLDRDLTAIQYSISSTNEMLTKKIEPGAPSAARRLAALEKINRQGFWTTVRLNPFFPIYPDGYFTNPDFKWDGPVPKFDFSSFEMIDEIAATGTKSVLAGIVRLSPYSIKQIETATGFNYKQFFTNGRIKSTKDYHFSDSEVRHYYERIKKECIKNAMEFTTCYIGNGEGHFWKDQDLWSNKADCCNAKGKVGGFVNDSRSLSFDLRKKISGKPSATPNDAESLERKLPNIALHNRHSELENNLGPEA